MYNNFAQLYNFIFILIKLNSMINLFSGSTKTKSLRMATYGHYRLYNTDMKQINIFY